MTRFDSMAARVIARRFLHESTIPPPPDVERALAIRAMTTAARAQRFRTPIRLASAAAVAALLAGAGTILVRRGDVRNGVPALAPTAALSPRTGGFEPRPRPDVVRLPDGEALVPGQKVVAKGPGGIVLSTASGTGLWLEAAAELVTVDDERAQWFKLTSGRVHVEVAPLRLGRRFVIETADSEVEVHGTGFEVQVVPPNPDCRGGTVTRVTVVHGVVEVRSAGRTERVSAGEQWPPECAPRDAAPRVGSSLGPPRSTASFRAKRATATAAAPPKVRPTIAAGGRGSELAAQNDLFGAALADVARGQPRRAIASLDELLARWPESPLRESAAAERLRLHCATGDARAAQLSAREYLRRFPNGFARAEAKALAGALP